MRVEKERGLRIRMAIATMQLMDSMTHETLNCKNAITKRREVTTHAEGVLRCGSVLCGP